MGVPDDLPIAVVGAGFSGTMVAIHLLRARSPLQRVVVFERSGCFGRGLAYATQSHDHLLNVRAANMSALPDDPEHFTRWLNAGGNPPSAAVHQTSAGTYASRGLYGRYLADLIASTLAGLKNETRLVLEHDDVMDLAATERGYILNLASGRRVEAAGVVLACGNIRANLSRKRYAVDPWRVPPLHNQSMNDPFLIVGTGLTMVDAVASVRKQGFVGQILALSRRGLLPHTHAPAQPWPTPQFFPDEERSLLRLLMRVRKEVAAAARAGIGWRGVIDSLRPKSVALWQGLPGAERERFVRHLRAYWDVHRHRAAPPTNEMICRELAAGRLGVLRGRIESICDGAGGAIVTIRERGAATSRELRVSGIVDATGVGRVSDTDDPLLRQLLARGDIVPDALSLGLSATRDLAVIDRGGGHSRPLWTIGPLLRGTLWECTAVPDIREQAAALAYTIAGTVAESSSRRRQVATIID